ncbi:MAG: glycoside hydrolase family 9 protein [Marinilabiliaceae bacterium]|jgi:peptidoglycan/xylan/chitin deacetylase (PgdA/CDA1 family)|nr:glycoside hydrolase family 9 protein [Marinilabiliaceae bacterium]
MPGRKSFFRVAIPLLVVSTITACNTYQENSDGALLRGDSGSKKIALVFTGDQYADGGDYISGILDSNNTKASFFLTGNFYRDSCNRDLIIKLRDDGHYLGAHSDRHLLYCDWENRDSLLIDYYEFSYDINQNYREMMNFGIDISEAPYFMPPYEWYNERIVEWSSLKSLQLVSYTPGTLSHADYTVPSENSYRSTDEIFRSISDYEENAENGLNGFLLLMHIGTAPERTDKLYYRLDSLVSLLSGKGYEFVRVDSLLAEKMRVRSQMVQLNQMGYLKGEQKKALLVSSNKPAEDFYLLESGSNMEIERLLPARYSGKVWDYSKQYYYLDFTHIDTEGDYYIAGSKSGQISACFRISDTIYGSGTGKLLEFMRQQRCGYNPLLNIYCHQDDGRSMFGPMPDSSFVDCRGGWHDAGDQLKYLLTTSYATAHMLKAYELFPDIFSDRVDKSGRAGKNSLPDVIDEAKWGLDWIEKLHPHPDVLIHQVADDRDHMGWKMPDNDNSDYGWGPNSYRVAYYATGKPQGAGKYLSESDGMSNIAGRSAAAMALAAGIWSKNFGDSSYAEKSLSLAKSLYILGKKFEGVQQGNSYGAPYRYGEESWQDDMEWAAAELYGLTSDSVYLEDAIRYARLAAAKSWHGLDTAKHYQHYPFVNIGHHALYRHVNNEFRDTLAMYYRTGIEATLKKAVANPYNIGIPFIWCSNNLLTSLITQIILYEDMTGDLTYHNYLIDLRDWLFGRNPWSTSMFTSLPAYGEYPIDIHTSIWALTGIEVPGGLIDGPVYASIFNSLKGLHLSNPDEFSDFQNNYIVYHDDIGDYSTNEPTMDGTAGSMIMMAYFSSY